MRIFLTVMATFALISVPMTGAMALEEPDYEVLKEGEDYELRRYAPYLVAQTEVDGDFRRAGNSAFRVLAGYIFGDNAAGEKMSMTAPVVSTMEPEPEEMQTYQFVMESAYDLDTLPVPNDARVEIVALPERLVAAHRFSGRWSESKTRELTDLLLQHLREDGFEAISDPMLARYNPPFTPWFMRRNEILVDVRPTENLAQRD